MNTKLGIAAIIVAVVALGVVYFAPTPVKEVVREVVKEQFGAVPGPELTSEIFCFGGVCNWRKAGGCYDATTTLFAIQNPFRATSTWISAFVEITGGASSGPIGITVATSTNTGAASTSDPDTDYPGWGLIDGVSIAQAAFGFIRSGGVFATTTAQNVSFNGPNYPHGFGLSPGTTTHQVVLGPDDYIVGHATGTGVSSLVPATNPFSCEYGIEFQRHSF